MDVVSTCALPVASLLWQPRAGVYTLTVVCRATFLLQPGESTLAPEQEPPSLDDVPSGDPARSLHAPSDLAPLKPLADVVLVGSAFAPGGQPARSFVARLAVGDVEKAVEVFGDRAFGADGGMREGAGVTRMPLTYERAAGGPETWNPVGVRGNVRDAYRRIPLPNIQRPGLDVTSPQDFVEPIGFGPIHPLWPTRRERLGRHAATWSPRDWHHSPMPDDLDPAFFCVAPADQQLRELRDGTRVVLDNLHPEHPRLSTRLPVLRPVAVLEGRAQGPLEMPMRCDTLWIDTDRGLATLTWRAQVLLEHAREHGRVVVKLPRRAQPERVRRPDPGTVTGMARFDVAEAPAPLPFMANVPAPTPASRSIAERPAGGLPFQVPAPAPTFGAPPPAPSRLSESSTSWAPPAPVEPPPVAPPVPVQPPSFAVAPPPSFAVAPPPPAPVPQPSFGAPPPLRLSESSASWMPAPVEPPAPAPEPAVAPSLSRSMSGGESPWAPAAPGAARTFEPTARPSHFPPLPAPVVEPARATPAPVVSLPRPARAPVEAAPAEEARVLELIWFEPKSLPRLRRKAEYKSLLRELENEPLDEDDDEPSLAADAMDVEDRRDVFEILARGEAISSDPLGDALASGVRRGGRLVPPLVLITTELHLPFDERETLRATIATVTPLVGNDEALKAAVEAGNELLRFNALSSTAAVADALTARIRDAFNGGKRVVPAGYLEAQTERALLEQRSYQRRPVLGGTRIRAICQPGAVPTYLPDEIAKKLPLFQRFRARLLAEVRLAADQYETHAAALDVVALARSAPMPRRSDDQAARSR
jgi:hypothetical protein